MEVVTDKTESEPAKCWRVTISAQDVTIAVKAWLVTQGLLIDGPITLNVVEDGSSFGGLYFDAGRCINGGREI